ncbi:MAG: hypothetical protein LCI00_21495 [Chloroflexi bacterium]|nr:hypothetical protein [Chloroflexota bacterium]MCC6895030.1 hypothetical protein [Anaerolineae bacterium]
MRRLHYHLLDVFTNERFGGNPNPAHIISEQGFEMGRPSYIHIEIHQAAGAYTFVGVGGECVYMGEGSLEISNG